MTLACLENIHDKPCTTSQVKTWLSESTFNDSCLSQTNNTNTDDMDDLVAAAVAVDVDVVKFCYV